MCRTGFPPFLRQLLQVPIEPEPGQRGENLSCFPEVPYGSMATNSCANLSKTPTPRRCSVSLNQTRSVLSLHLTPTTEDPLCSGIITTSLDLGVFLQPAFLGQLTLLPLSLAFWLCVVSPFPAVWSYSPAGRAHPLFSALSSGPLLLPLAQLGSQGTRLFEL